VEGIGDSMKPGPRGISNKIKTANIDTELVDKENPESNHK
jgi:hypothetical protein